MCIGIPMRVTESRPGICRCEGRGESCEVDMALVGDQPVGGWVLVQSGVARDVLDDARAHQVDRALDALEAAMRGEQALGLFPDLEDREPRLPPHLEALAGC